MFRQWNLQNNLLLRLLTAVLDALKPFSQMMGELLQTYEAAGAVSNNKNIQIRFNFDDGPEQYDLNAFRKKVEIIGDGVETRRKLIDPWKFLEPLYMYENKGTFPKGYNFPKEIEQWLRDYENDIPLSFSYREGKYLVEYKETGS